jgi:hypothetical protein
MPHAQHPTPPSLPPVGGVSHAVDDPAHHVSIRATLIHFVHKRLMDGGSLPLKARLGRDSTELGNFLPETPVAAIVSRQAATRGWDWAPP